MTSFIEDIAGYVKKYAGKYGIKVHSPIIAQAILESASGTSELAVNAHNYFGLKYRKGRCPTASGIYNKVGSEQLSTGLYVTSRMQWCKFPNMESGVIGYFDFINISNYSNLKGVTDPKTYLERIKADGYATSINYVTNLMNVIQKYNLTKYDDSGVINMGYTNSSLAKTKILSANHYNGRSKIDTITIHCMAGQMTAAGCGQWFKYGTPDASSNYGIGYDGSIGLYVEEKNASWCSSNKANDMRAITIEVASDSKPPYAVRDKAYNALIPLVADICKRNGIKKLVWSNNASDRVNHRNGCNMTVHRDFANKPCPGQYLYDRMPAIAKKVNAQLSKTSGTIQKAVKKTVYDYSKYDAFEKKWLGKGVDYDKSYGYQCWDAVAQYAHELGYTLPNCTQSNYVKDIANLKATNGILKWCDDIALNGQELKKGDIVIWDGGMFPKSHIAIYTGTDDKYGNGYYLGENQDPEDSSFTKKAFSSAYMIGCFRPKCFKKTINDGSINYRVHAQSYGWMDWIHDGSMAGTTGMSKRIEALQIYTTDGTVIERVEAHMQGIGWKIYDHPGKDTIIGTTGQARRLEALKIKTSKPCKMRGHIQKLGWTDWVPCDGDQMIGTTGKSLRLEAIEIKRA